MKKRLMEWHQRHYDRLCKQFNDWLMSEGMWDFGDEVDFWFYSLVNRVFKWLGW